MFRPDDEDDDDSDDDFTDDEELQSPIDEVDPFIFFVDTVKGKLPILPFKKCQKGSSLPLSLSSLLFNIPAFENKFACSDASIRSIEVSEPHPDA